MLSPATKKEVLKKKRMPSVTEGKKEFRRSSDDGENEQECSQSASLSLKAINNCPACQGAVFRYSGKYGGYRSWEEKNLSQCLFCGRIYTLSDKGFQLWPPRPKKSNREKLVEDFGFSHD